MEIIAHRGFWKTEAEKNSMTALKRAIENGYGFETDFRDCAGKLVISHNPPIGNETTAEEVFKMYAESKSNAPLALDIKADGLQDMMITLLTKYNITNYFMVDMSVCDTVVYIEKGIKIASRSSEFEPILPFYNNSDIIWIDYFDGRINIVEELKKYIKDEKIPCIVSPELHKLPYENLWKVLSSISDKLFYLCTDYPEEAKKYFNL